MKIKAYSNELNATVDLIAHTFSDAEGETEGELIAQLALELLAHSEKHEVLGYLAFADEQIVGAIICSKMQFATSDIKSFILAPVAVHPHYQKQGIGKALIEFAKTDLAQQGVQLFITYGDPNYYAQLGFKPVNTTQIPAPQKLSMPQGWLAQMLDNAQIPNIEGQSFCVAALNKPIYW